MCGHCGVAKEYRLLIVRGAHEIRISENKWEESWLRDDEGFYSGYCGFYWLWLARRILQRAAERTELPFVQFWASLQGVELVLVFWYSLWPVLVFWLCFEQKWEIGSVERNG
jgi:hypothetical protein